MKEWSSIE